MGARPCPEEGRLLDRAVPSRSAWSDCRQRGTARARNKRACCTSSSERASAVARKRATRASHLSKWGSRASTWEHGLAPKKGGFSLVQCPSVVHGAIAASTARRAHAASACAAPPPQREPAQWRASALHAQATSRSEGQGWHVKARQCIEEGRLLARAVSFFRAWSICRQHGAARARSKRKCCASSLERASAVARKRATRASHLAT